MESGQSQFAALKLRSLALVRPPGHDAPLRTPLMAAPLQDSSLRAERSGQRLAVVPRPGFAGQYAKGSNKIERNQYSKGSAMKRSAFGWFVPARSLRSLPAQ